MMGVGKSSSGEALARLLRVPFVDADRQIEQQAGCSVAEVFERRGEQAFRSLERALVEAQLADPRPRVVALGGGALLDRPLRLRLLAAGTVLTLRADVGELLSRASAQPGQRPLLDGDPGRLSALLDQRQAAYAESHGSVDTTGRSVEQVAEALRALVAEADLVVALGLRSYPVRVGRGPSGLRSLLARVAPSSGLAVLDPTVGQLHGARIERDLPPGRWSRLDLPPGEAAKNPGTLLALWSRLQAEAMDRQGLVLGVGGGVTTDLAGLAAATWLRGVRWVAAPTTLLGAVDAAVGGKTAIDLGDAKNMVGVIHQPAAVSIDIDLLATEPARGFASGMAEVVKTALIGDHALLDAIESKLTRSTSLVWSDEERIQIVRSAVAVKAAIVSRDEHEQGERRVLNLGHTLGHALEAQGGFARWTHGEAVALGMIAALRLGESLGVTEAGLAARVTALLARLGLPHVLAPGDLEAALPWLLHDKKREQQSMRYVLVERPGRPAVRSLPLADLARGLRAACG